MSSTIYRFTDDAQHSYIVLFECNMMLKLAMAWFWVLLATVLCTPIYEDFEDIDTNSNHLGRDVGEEIRREIWKSRSKDSVMDINSDVGILVETKSSKVNKQDTNKQFDKLIRSERSIDNNYEKRVHDAIFTKIDGGKSITEHSTSYDTSMDDDESNVNKAQESSNSMFQMSGHSLSTNDGIVEDLNEDQNQEFTRDNLINTLNLPDIYNEMLANVKDLIDTDETNVRETIDEVKGVAKDVINTQGLTITATAPDLKDYARFLPHKSPETASSVNLKSLDKDGLLDLIRALYERQNLKRSIYDDGDVKSNTLEERDPGAILKPIYHMYTGELTLQDIYLKMGGVCTLIEGFSARPIYVISSCPKNSPLNNIWYYCEKAIPFNKRFHQENIIDIITTPVQDSSGFVYKNVYCAQCNGIVAMTAWSTKLDCDHFQSVELSDGRQQVRILDQFADKDQGCSRQLKPEIKRMIHECPLDEVVKTMNMRIHDIRVGEGSQSELSPFPLSYTLFMNFGFDGKTHILFITKPAEEQSTYGHLCKDDEMYDPHGLKCRPMSCNEGYELVGRTCQKTTHYASDTTSGDLFTLDEIENPIRVTLTTQNVSLFDLTTLCLMDIGGGLESVLQDMFSVSFNISKDRIQNVTISLFNTSDATNELSREEVIFIILSTTRSPDRPSTLPTSIQTIIKANEIVAESVEVDVEPDDDSEEERGEESEDVDDALRIEDVVVPVSAVSLSTSTVNPGFDVVYSNMSVNISFILYPAHKNRIYLEKTTKSVVTSMSEMVKSNVFFITINGTDFAINSIYNVSDVPTMDTFCEFGKQADYYMIGEQFVVDTEYIPDLDLNVTVIYVNRTGRTYYPGQYDLTYSLDGVMGKLDETDMECFVIVCDMPEILDEQCSRIILTPDEYEILREENEMSPPFIEFANHTYSMDEFELQSIDEGTVRICAPNWSMAYMTNSTSEWAFACGNDLVKLVIAESYLTFILGLISIVCLLSVLITYSVFEKLRNLPGINTISLTLALFLGELVFMVSGWLQPHQWLCSTIGVLLHFLFLASFFWMNIMSYDVYCTFAKGNILGGIRSKKKYAIRYSLYAWGGPLVIVSICSVIDFGGIFDNIAIGYGGSRTGSTASANKSFATAMNESLSEATHIYSIGCWIQEPIASMAAFGGPMMLILLSNCVMFIRTIICIRANTRSTKDSIRKSSVNNNKVGHDDVMLYVRMSTVMGFTWIFGLASSVVSAFSSTPTHTSCIVLHLLAILFIVFNCSQGIFIFFVFVFNRRVFALYKGLFQRMKRRRKKPVSVSSSCATISSAVSQSSFGEITHL